jgi:hypothetical protein
MLNPGDSKEVVLEVENAFKTTAREVVPLSRPAAPTILQMPAQGGAR